MRTRTVLFRVTCSADRTGGHEQVMRLLATRSIIPDLSTTKTLPDDRITLSVLISDAFGVQAVYLARIFERLPSVSRVELEVDGRAVDFHRSRAAAAHE